MPSTEVHIAANVAERIRAQVAASPIPTMNDEPVPLQVSIGVAARSRGQTEADVEARADEALYRAKGAGRNRVEVAP